MSYLRHSLSLGAFSAHARTKKQAREKLDKQLEEALSGDYTPRIHLVNQYLILVWREPVSGWRYTIIKDGVYPRKVGGTVIFPGTQDPDKLLNTALYDLAQREFRLDDYRNVPAYLTDPCYIKEYKGWAQWQHDYAKARQQGLSDSSARERAFGGSALAT